MSRLLEILHRKAAASVEETRARIRESVEASTHVCPVCGWKQFVGGIHPFAGRAAQTKAETRWCNGAQAFEPKNKEPRLSPWLCRACGNLWQYTSEEIELADSDGQCHVCAGSPQKGSPCSEI